MTVDREQIRRDIAHQIEVGSGFGFPAGHWVSVLADVLADLEQAEREREEAREDVARCAADTTAADLAQDIECMKAERKKLETAYARELSALQAADRREAALAEALRRISERTDVDVNGEYVIRDRLALSAVEANLTAREALAAYKASKS